MEKLLEIHDNVIPKFIVDNIEKYLLKDSIVPLFYVPNLTYQPSSPEHHFSPGILNTFLNNENKHNDQLGLFSSVLYGFSLYRQITITQYIQGRCFIDLPTPNFGPDLPPHTDLTYPHLVCLYYVNNSDGDTILFKDDKKTEIKRISPKKGRCVFFDGSIPHCGSRSEVSTRAILNFNFLGEFQ